MKYPKEYLEEIKTRLKVSQVVSKSVSLKKRGKEFVGLSPFSNEKTPSFTVNDEKGFYHCFSTTEHGNIFDFVMKTENLKFGEAVRKLASVAGMPIYKFTKFDEEKEKSWEIYKKILNSYSQFYTGELKTEKFNEIKSYLKKRKIDSAEIDFFNIGYVDYSANFYNQIISKFKKEDILNSGLFYLDERNKKIVERFRGRIIFPIKNAYGSIIGLGGRATKSSNFAKYINSPETMFFKKGFNLYNINSAKNYIDKKNEVILVEGFIDVISLHKHGIKNVVANQGTALTEKQLDLAWRYFKNLIICFDGDQSGKNAAIRAAERFFSTLKTDHNIYFLFLPDNMDPDSYINANGKLSFLKLIEKKITIYDFLWNFYLNKTDENDPLSLASFEKKIKSLCRELKDDSMKKFFTEYFLNKLSNLTPLVNNQRKNYKKLTRPLKETKEINSQKNALSKRSLKEFSLLYLIINNLDFFSKQIELISEIKFEYDETIPFASKLIDGVITGKITDQSSFAVYFKDSKFQNLIKKIADFAPVKTIANNENDISKIISIFNEICSELKKIELDSKIENLEKKLAEEMDEKLYNEILALKNTAKS